MDAGCQIGLGFIERSHDYFIIRDMTKKCNIEIHKKMIRKIIVSSVLEGVVVLHNDAKVIFSIVKGQ